MKNFLFGLASNPAHIITISIAQVLEAAKGYAFNCIFLVTHGHVCFPEAAMGVEGFWKAFDVIGVNIKDSYIDAHLAMKRQRARGFHPSEISEVQTRSPF